MTTLALPLRLGINANALLDLLSYIPQRIPVFVSHHRDPTQLAFRIFQILFRHPLRADTEAHPQLNQLQRINMVATSTHSTSLMHGSPECLACHRS